MALDVPDTKYLFQRSGSQNWYLRLVYPADDGKRRKVIERSLGVIDKHEAWQAAADSIKKHKAVMLERRQARVARIVHGPWQSEYTPGLHTLPDGRTLIATERDLTFSDGTRRPNGGPMIYLTGARLTPMQEINTLADAWDGKLGEGPVELARPVVANAKTDPDTALLNDYIKFGAIKKKNGRGGKPLNSVREKQARSLWATFKQVVDKPLKDCGYDDGVKLVEHIETEHQKKHGKPIKAATVQRMLVPLIALTTRALTLKKLTGANPFIHVGSNGAASDIVDGFSDQEMALIRKHMEKLDKNDQLLLRFAASTGMDRGELFGVKSEATKDGIRYITISKGKTESWPRVIPLPKILLPHIKKPITKQLFTGRPDTTGKRLTEFMEGIGIVMDKGVGEDGQKHVLHCLHSFRHRAETRLNDAYPKADRLHNTIGGWSSGGRKNARWGYGEFPMATLKEAIDTIGGL